MAVNRGTALVDRDRGFVATRTARHGGGGGGLIWPRHGTDDFGFRPVGFANKTATPAKSDSTRRIQNRVGIFTSP
jgi:hypothetical protein